MGDQFDRIEEPVEVLLQETVFDLGAFLESLLDDIFHNVKILYFISGPVKDTFPLTPVASRLAGWPPEREGVRGGFSSDG